MTRNERTIGIGVGLKETIIRIAYKFVQISGMTLPGLILPIHFLYFKITVLYGTYANI